MSEEMATRCAAEVAELARDKRFTARSDELTALAADLSKAHGDTWAGVDLFAAFPADASITIRRAGTTLSGLLEQLLGVLAAVSVFAPVAWTWLEFRRASAAYQAMIAARREPEGRTFLGMWATGFDGRLDAGSQLASVASTTLRLIVLAVAIIVVHRLLATRNVRREERDHSDARIALARTLTSASLVLNERRADHPQRIEGIIKSSLDKLRKTQDAARKAVSELSVTAVNVGAGVNELLGTVSRARSEAEALLSQATTANLALEGAVTTAGQSLTGAVTSLDGAVRTGLDATFAGVTRSAEALDHVVRTSVEVAHAAVTRSVEALDSSVQQGIRSSNETARETSHQLSQDLTEALTEFERSMAQHVHGLTRDSVTAISSSGSALMGVVDRIGASTEASSEAAVVLAKQVTAMRDDTITARDELNRSLDDVRAALESIEIVLSRHESTLQGHASELTGTRDAAERMLRQLTSSLASPGRDVGVLVDTGP